MSSLWAQHRTAIVISVITTVLGGITLAIVTGLGKWGMQQFNPDSASSDAGPRGNVVVVDWRTFPDTPTNPAYATIEVHNDGNASAGACFAYWVTANGKRLAASSEFGLAPSDATNLRLTRTVFSYSTKRATSKIDTYAYVRCGGDNFKSSPHIASTLYPA